MNGLATEEVEEAAEVEAGGREKECDVGCLRNPFEIKADSVHFLRPPVVLWGRK